MENSLNCTDFPANIVSFLRWYNVSIGKIDSVDFRLGMTYFLTNGDEKTVDYILNRVLTKIYGCQGVTLNIDEWCGYVYPSGRLDDLIKLAVFDGADDKELATMVRFKYIQTYDVDD